MTETQMKNMNSYTRMIQSLIMSCVALALVAFSSSSVFAKNYINWENEYYFHIPDDWQQIERYNVEEFLRLHGKNPADMTYDAFFCPKDAQPFWSKAYVFVSSEKMENSYAMADSLVQGMASEFARMVKSEDSLGPITRVESRQPKLNRKTRTITQVSNLNVQGQKQVLYLVLKFHRSGITTFYFYSLADLFKTYEPTFNMIVSSFSDENLNEAQEAGSVVIVDVSGEDSASSAATSSKEPSNGSGFSGFYDRYGSYIGLAFFLIAYIVYMRVKRKQGGG